MLTWKSATEVTEISHKAIQLHYCVIREISRQVPSVSTPRLVREGMAFRMDSKS
jgi:hypothetical protein